MSSRALADLQADYDGLYDPDPQYFSVLHSSAPTDDDPFDPDITTPIEDGDEALIIVEDGTWLADAITIDQTDASIRIVGARLYDNTDVIIERAAGNATYDLIAIEGDNTDVRIEFLTLTGAADADAVAVTEDADVLLRQVQIVNNLTGVEAGDAASTDSPNVLLTNCSIRVNTDGVVVHDNAIVEALFCSILYNGTSGVSVDTDVTDAARVWNSLIYGNGTDLVTAGTANIHAAYIYLTAPTAATLAEDMAADVILDETTDGSPPVFVIDPSNGADLTAWGEVDFGGTPYLGMDYILAGWFDDWEDNDRLLPDGFSWDADDYAYEDFDEDVRPQGTGYDIGADEYDLGLIGVAWAYCLVIPQEPYEAVGRTVPGHRELPFEVWIGFSGSLVSTVDGVRAWFVPQGGDSADIDDWVTIDSALTTMEVGNGTPDPLDYYPALDLYRGEGRILSTVIDNRDVDVRPSAGDLIADGHAAIYIQYSDGSSWVTPLDSAILSQARVGRHFLIDTVDPRLYGMPKQAVSMVSWEGAVLQPVLNPPNFGHNLSGAFGARSIFIDTTAVEMHPYPSLPTTWRPASLDWSFSDDAIEAVPGASDGAKAFFNPGSYSNNWFTPGPSLNDGSDYPENLNIKITATLMDPPVTDPSGVRLTGLTPSGLGDPFISDLDGQDNRQVTGFPVSASYTQGQDLYEPAPLQFTNDAALPASIANYSVSILYSTAASMPATGDTPYDENRAFPYGSAAGELAPVPSIQGPPNLLTVEYTFQSYETANPMNTQDGIHWIGSPVGTITGPGWDNLHLAAKFIGVDLAGNQALQSTSSAAAGMQYSLALDPLHLWWLLRARTRLLPNCEGQEVNASRLNLTWDLQRDKDPAGRDEYCRPLFTYRIWESFSGTRDSAYWAPITGWAAWSDLKGLGPSFWEDVVDSGYADNWLLIVVAGADEAGNVEPWPWEDWSYDDSDANTATGVGESLEYLAASTAGANWQRFYLKGPAASLDTTAKISFWHQHTVNALDRRNLGSNQIVPVPSSTNYYLRTQFDLGVAYDSFAPNTIRVAWQLVRGDGVLVQDGTTGLYQSPDEIQSVIYQIDPAEWPTNLVREIPMVLRAWAVLNGTTTYDTTPVNIPFTLVWQSVPTYVAPVDDSDEQPVKIQEKE